VPAGPKHLIGSRQQSHPQTSGARWASRDRVSDSVPPNTVKSLAKTKVLRPLMVPQSVTTPSPGTSVYSMPNPMERCSTNMSNSSKAPCRKPPLNPDVADTAPADSMLTPYDHEHAITYLRLLDADAVGADWKAVTQIVLHIDPEREPVRARLASLRKSSHPRQVDDRAGLSTFVEERLA